MTIEILKPASREAWLDLRRQTIGASESACLFGEHPWLSAYELHCLKTGLLVADPTETGPMRRGRHLEAVAVEFLREERPDWIIKANAIPGGDFYRDMESGLSSTPDCFANDPAREGFGSVQIKSVDPLIFRRKWKQEDGTVEPPLYVVIQAIQDAMLSGASWAAVCPLVIGFGIEMPILDVPLHEGVLKALPDKAREFWEGVKTGTPPDFDPAKDGDAIRALYKDGGGAPMDLSKHNSVGFLCEEKLAWARRAGNAERALEEVDAEIRALLKNAEAGLHPDFNITLKKQATGGYTIPRGETRVLRITRKKDGAA